LNYVQGTFPGEAKKVPWGLRPPCAPRLRTWAQYNKHIVVVCSICISGSSYAGTAAPHVFTTYFVFWSVYCFNNILMIFYCGLVVLITDTRAQKVVSYTSGHIIDFLYDAHLHPTFLFDRFKCLMLFTNLHFSSII